MEGVTQVLSRLEQGDPSAAEQLLPLVYNELRTLAAAKLFAERPGQTLQPTALVHEAYLRLVDVKEAQHWSSRGHFFAAAAESMRRILVEAARRKRSIKRGGDGQRRDLLEGDMIGLPIDDDLIDLNDAIDRLHVVDPQSAEIVKLRVFAGLTIDEVAEMQGVSPRTVKRGWAYGRAWLGRALDAEADGRS